MAEWRLTFAFIETIHWSGLALSVSTYNRSFGWFMILLVAALQPLISYALFHSFVSHSSYWNPSQFITTHINKQKCELTCDSSSKQYESETREKRCASCPVPSNCDDSSRWRRDSHSSLRRTVSRWMPCKMWAQTCRWRWVSAVSFFPLNKIPTWKRRNYFLSQWPISKYKLESPCVPSNRYLESSQ